NHWYSIKFQLKPELADPPLMRDSRVRKALAFTIDKQALNDGLFGGAGSIAESMIHPTVDYFPLVDRAITKYPLDLRRAEQLMIEAGLRKGADGFYAATDGERFTPELKTNTTPDNDALRSSLASHWRDAGFEVKNAVLSAAQAQDAQARANFASMFANNAGLGDVLLNSI